MTDSQKAYNADEQMPKTPNAADADTNVQDGATIDSPVLNADEEVAVTEEENRTEAKNVHNMTKEELVGTLRTIVENNDVNAHKEVNAIKQAIFALRQRELADQLSAYIDEGNDPTTFVSTPDPLEEEAKELQTKFREMRTAYLEAEEQRKNANLERKKSIVREILSLTEDIDNINLNFPKFQELQQAFKEAGDVPAPSESEVWKSYQAVVEKFYDCLNVNKELRALDFKKNLEAKQNLIVEAKSLAELEDVIEAGRRLQQLHIEWREIGPVAKELRDEIWEKFREASSVVNKRHQEHFEQRKANEQINEEGKTALCVELEAIDINSLTTYAMWDEAQEKIKDMQRRWKTFGPASRKVNNALYQRFREACDAFFNARKEFTRARHELAAANLKRKEELCQKVEALLETPNANGVIDTVIKLQAEWKTVGNAGKKVNDEIWNRFITACNTIFDAHKKVTNERRNAENANLEAKRNIIAKLREIPLDIERKEGLHQVRILQNQWQETGHVPFKQKDKIFAEYREVCDRLYDAFNASRSQERRRNFEDQIKNLKGDENRIERERDKMLRAIEQRRQELKTYENNLGFFNVRSSAGNSMVKEMEKKMNRLKQEIEEIEEKIRLLAES